MIDLNSEEFDGGSNVAIFNGGNAGVASNCTLTVEKKDPAETRRLPSWKVVATDASGASTDLPLYYLDDPTNQYYASNLTKQGKLLKHLIKVVVGDGVKIPQFANPTEMLDKCMELISSKAAGKKFHVFANYGTKGSKAVNGYIKIRTFVPFLATDASLDSLTVTPYDTMRDQKLMLQWLVLQLLLK